MGVCRFCGQEAGFLKTVHDTCTGKLTSAIANYLSGSAAIGELDTVATELGAKGPKGQDVFTPLWDSAVVRALDDGVLTVNEEERLMSAARLFGFGQSELDKKGQYMHLAKAA